MQACVCAGAGITWLPAGLHLWGCCAWRSSNTELTLAVHTGAAPRAHRYPYSVAGPGGFGVDVLKKFQESCEKAGIGHGFYYSLTNNFFLNVLHHNVSVRAQAPCGRVCRLGARRGSEA